MAKVAFVASSHYNGVNTYLYDLCLDVELGHIIPRALEQSINDGAVWRIGQSDFYGY